MKQSFSPVCTQNGLLDSVFLSYVGSENASFETPKSSGCRPNLRERWVGEKISLCIDKGNGIVVSRRQSKKTMRRSLCFLWRYFEEGRLDLIFGHGVPT